MVNTSLLITLSLLSCISTIHAGDRGFLSTLFHSQFPLDLIGLNSQKAVYKNTMKHIEIYANNAIHAPIAQTVSYETYMMTCMLQTQQRNEEQELVNFKANCFFALSALTKRCPERLYGSTHIRACALGLLVAGTVLKLEAAWKLPHVDCAGLLIGLGSLEEEVQKRRALLLSAPSQSLVSLSDHTPRDIA